MKEAELEPWLNERDIHTVRVVWSDMHGHLRGKTLPRTTFTRDPAERVAFCDGALAWDVTAAVFDDIAFSNFDTGYPDMLARPDLETLRPLGWLEGHAMVFGEIEDHHGHSIELSPRYLMRRLAGLLAEQRSVTLQVRMDFHVFARSDPAPHMEPGPERPGELLEPLHGGLAGTQIPVEALERDGNQFRLVLSPSEPVSAADRAVIAKNAVKEMLVPRGWGASFMARPRTGPLNHFETVLLSEDDGGIPADWEDGLRRNLPQMMPLLCPTINAYKRLRVVRERLGDDQLLRPGYSHDGRKGLVQSVTGADANPYLSVMAQIATLLEVEEETENSTGEGTSPAATLGEGLEVFRTSPIPRRQLGDEFVEHHANILDHEVEQFRTQVTDWEENRYREIV